MLLRDQLTNKKETQVRYLARKEHTVPEAWLNPMFLARNPARDRRPEPPPLISSCHRRSTW